MSMRGVGLTLLVLCIAGGLISAFFTPGIAATLTLPANSGTTQIARPTTSPTRGGEPLPTTVADGAVVLAHDTFQRPNQPFWGSSSDGRHWSGDANTNQAFSIVKSAGQISGGKGALQAILDVNSPDSDLLITGTVSAFTKNGNVNVGTVLRWKDVNNWYKILIDGSSLQLLRSVQGTVQSLAKQPFSAQDGTAYSMRFRALGSNLFAKVWPAANAEPEKWMLRVVDTTLTSGVCGIRVVVATDTVIRITSFLETNVPAPTT